MTAENPAEPRYRSRTLRSARAFERTEPVIPGGVPGGLAFTKPHPTYISRGEGCLVWDADGNEMLDLMAGDWLLPLGHRDPEVVAAIEAQLARGTTFGAPDPDLGENFVQLLRMRLPSLDRVRFTTSGTEATLTTLRLARAFTGRPKVAKIRGGYHGTHDSSLIANGRSRNPDLVPPGLVPGTAEHLVLLPFNRANECEAIIEERKDELAAVIVEPMLGGTGMIPAHRGFLERLRTLTARHEIVLIFDEVVTFALGPHGAQGHYGVTPDLTCLGKAIGGGLPLGAFGGRRELMDLVDPLLDPWSAMRHASTCGGIPMCLAAGMAQVRQLTEEVHAHLHELGDLLRAGVRDLAARHGIPLQATGIAHFFGLHWASGEIVDYETALASDRRVIGRLMLSLHNEGCLIFTNGTGVVSAPMTDEHVHRFLVALERALVEQALIA